jgi:hypothetical protein
MKKLIIAFILSAGMGSCAVQAHDGFRYRGGYVHPGPCYGCGWVAPLIIGGVVGYEINRANQPVIIQQPPVIIQQPPHYIQAPPAGYHWQEMIDPQTNTTKIVLVPN